MRTEEKITSYETLLHIQNVAKILNKIVAELLHRAIDHDQSKLKEPELPIFVEYVPKLAVSTYGSDEYKRLLNEMKPALDHHYANNRHHPEHFKNGIEDMTLIDVIEMLCDWKAAALRHGDSDIFKGIEINKKRFDISDQLISILKNTVEVLE